MSEQIELVPKLLRLPRVPTTNATRSATNQTSQSAGRLAHRSLLRQVDPESLGKRRESPGCRWRRVRRACAQNATSKTSEDVGKRSNRRRQASVLNTIALERRITRYGQDGS